MYEKDIVAYVWCNCKERIVSLLTFNDFRFQTLFLYQYLIKTI